MLINRNTRISGNMCVLVPYKEEHVAKYHQWMQSEQLQALTASEPLTLDEEYQMQKSWMIDENKCTFIILDKEKFEETADEIESMIGDTNLFFANSDDRICAEAEIMVAEEWARGRKCGTEAMLLMFIYGITRLDVKQFVVKISEGNQISLHMFESFGFVEVSRSVVFQEVTLSKVVDDSWLGWLNEDKPLMELKKLMPTIGCVLGFQYLHKMELKMNSFPEFMNVGVQILFELED